MKKVTLYLFLLVSAFSFSQVGINTITPQSTLDINGNVSFKVVNLNGGPGGAATPIVDGYYINLVPTSGNLQFILPNAALYPGRMYILRNISNSYDATIYSFGGSFFAGDNWSAQGSITMASGDGMAGNSFPSKTIIIISDSVNWTYGYFHM